MCVSDHLIYMNWKRHKLRLVTEKEARGRTKEIFEEIKQAMGVPHVNIIFQALASFPEFFNHFWKTAKPLLHTQEFFSFSERIAAEAYTRMHNYFSVPALAAKTSEMDFSPAARAELEESAELYYYNCSALLLLSAALVQAFENPGTEAVNKITSAVAHPIFSKKPILVEEEKAPPATRKIYDDIKRALGTPFLSSSYLNFARWPDFLSVYWEGLKPVMKTPLYEQNHLALRDSALTLAAALPQSLQLSTAQLEEAAIPKDNITAIVHLADSFLDLLSKQMLNVAFVKIGLEDGGRSEAAA